MKTPLILLTTVLLTFGLCLRANAQTSSSAVDTNSAPSNSSTAAVDLPPADPIGTRPVIRYMGYMHGEGLDFSGTHQAGINGDSQMTYEQRVKFMAGFSDNIEAGVEVREKTNFGNGNNLNVTNGDWRLHSAFKNVLNSSVYNLILMPRLWLPISNKYHNQKATVSPDPEIELTITPRNSRFKIDTGVEYIYLFHSDGATGSDYTNADTSILAPWLEVDYQTTPKTQLMLSYWPQFNSHARANGPMTSDFQQGGENEIDVGGYYLISKIWKFNPYIAAEMSDIGANGNSIAKNLQVNFLFTGQIF